MIVTTDAELGGLKTIGCIVGSCLAYMQSQVKAGMTTLELDDMGAAFLAKYGAVSAPKSEYRFPGTTCISLGEEAAHGIPLASRRLSPGELINIDVSASLDGFFADTGASMQVPPVDGRYDQLLSATRRALEKGMQQARAGVKLNVLGRAIEKEAKRSGFTIIQNLCSHGIGRTLHDEPDTIPSYHDQSERRRLKDGMVITIEPFVSTGAVEVYEAEDGWTLVNPPGRISAQFEHSMVIRRQLPPLILTKASPEMVAKGLR